MSEQNTTQEKSEKPGDQARIPQSGAQPEFPWFRGGVNTELLKEFVKLDKAGKLAF